MEHKRLLKRIFLSILVNIIIVTSFSQTTFAKDYETSSTSNHVYCIVYDINGNIREEGYLASSEQEFTSRAQNYGPRNIRSGEFAIFSNPVDYDAYHTLEATTVHFRFGLNKNINAQVKIVKTDYKTAYNSWYGYTGGFAFSASVPAGAHFYGYIGNNSSDTVTVNWATIDY